MISPNNNEGLLASKVSYNTAEGHFQIVRLNQ